VTEYTPSFRKIIPDSMNPYILDIYNETTKEIIDEYKEKRKKEAVTKKRGKEREKQTKLMKNNPEEKPIEKVEVKKPIASIVKNVVKQIKVEKTAAKPIIISKSKSDPIIIVKPKEVSISKVETQPIIITKKEETIKIQPIEVIINNDPITDDKEKEVPKEDEVQQINIIKEEPIETKYANIVQQTEEIEVTHFKVFQEKTISQEQFTKETTFTDTYAPNPDNPKQFEKWQTIQLRKESHEGYEEIEAKEISEEKENPEETMKAIEENKIQEITGEDKDVG
jgi:hypothetical protein